MLPKPLEHLLRLAMAFHMREFVETTVAYPKRNYLHILLSSLSPFFYLKHISWSNPAPGGARLCLFSLFVLTKSYYGRSSYWVVVGRDCWLPKAHEIVQQGKIVVRHIKAEHSEEPEPQPFPFPLIYWCGMVRVPHCDMMTYLP